MVKMPRMIEFICVSNNSEKAANLERTLAAAFPNHEQWHLTAVDGKSHDIFTGRR
jgi:hypothetical protein